VIHLYAFAGADVRLPAVAAIDGGTLEACRVGDVVAVISEVAEGDSGVEPDAVLAHGLVVEALRDVADAVLPVRFGARLVDREELTTTVGDRVADLRERLAAVRGCVEFGVRMVAADAEPGALRAADGTTYLRERLASVAQTDAVAAELHAPLARCARESVVTPGTGHTAAYLVGDDERAAFEGAVAGFVAAHPDITVLCTGPWAPYSFTEAR
jgi:Gas vesicle synthesis protein GvpL/GvpF